MPRRVPVSVADERFERLRQEPLETVGGSPGAGRILRSVHRVWEYRELLLLLVRREVKVRYKDSVFGVAWSLFRPLALLIVYYVAIGRFLGAERAIPDFAIYVFTGLMAWTLFSEVVNAGTASIVSNAGLIKKVDLPREVFPLSSVGFGLFNLAVQLVLLFVATFVFGAPPRLEAIAYVPVAIAVILVWATAISVLASAVNVYLRDTQYLVEISLMVMFWSTPTVYSWAQVQNIVTSPALQTIYLSNPVTVAILALQRTFWAAGADSAVPDHLMARLGVAFGIGVALLVVAQQVFARIEGNFAQEL